ncbi:MAG TPA: hypothetical protein PKC87_01965 [Candidatus Absconditabacterales bacterium]|nr:hypothetical protein [Candidatus Absconditabacterales bacterium]
MKKKILLTVLVVSLFGLVFAGKVTSWMDRDNPDGTGDNEVSTTITCGNNGTGTTIKYVEVAAVLTGPSLIFTGNNFDGMFGSKYIHIYGPYWTGPEKGMYCLNAENNGGCLDYKVRIACR